MMSSYLLEDTSELPSPSLLFYRALIEQNLRRALDLVGGETARLRPHVKTHKTIEIVRWELELGITKHKCATPQEAEMLAATGVPDVLIAYQMIGPNLDRLADMIERYPDTSFATVVDDVSAAEALSATMHQRGLSVTTFIDLDVGMHRTGIAPDERAKALYHRMAELRGIRLGGLHAYDGHNRAEDPEEREKATLEILNHVRGLRDDLIAQGLEVPTLVMGGTPPFPIYARQPDVESSPGTFVLHDCGYGSQLPDLGFVPAAILFSRVISRPTHELATIDLGHKAIGADPPGDRGTVLNVPGARVGGQSEEHWVLELTDPETQDRLSVGDPVYVCPTHICPTVALHEVVYIVEEGQVVDEWRVAARNRVRPDKVRRERR